MTVSGFTGTVGLAGCGAMGLPMARALRVAGIDCIGFDIRDAAEFGDFAPHMVADPVEFAARADVLISVVRDSKETLDLYFDDQALFRQSTNPKVCILSSTVSPRFLPQVADRLPADVLFYEAPMSGAPVAAEEARLTFMLGADEATAAPHAALYQAMGRVVHHLGGLGRGMTCKVLNNFVAASSVLAVRHVLKGAADTGLDPQTLLDVMSVSSGATWFGDNFHKVEWAGELYDPMNTIGILEKDVTATLDALGGDTVEELPAFLRALRDGLAEIPPAPLQPGK